MPALSCLTALGCVQLDENGIGNAGAASLGPALRHLCRLSFLSLSKNEISAAGAAALAPALSLLSQLSSLTLDGNPVGDEGVAHLVPALARLPCLRAVYFRQSDGLSDRGMSVLLKGLPSSVSVSLGWVDRRRLEELQRSNCRKWLSEWAEPCAFVLCYCLLVGVVVHRTLRAA